MIQFYEIATNICYTLSFTSFFIGLILIRLINEKHKEITAYCVIFLMVISTILGLTFSIFKVHYINDNLSKYTFYINNKKIENIEDINVYRYKITVNEKTKEIHLS